MKCTSCSAEVPASAKFCPECGAKIVRKSFCPECGAEASPGAKFCAECGTKLAAPQTAVGVPKGATAKPQPASTKPESAAPAVPENKPDPDWNRLLVSKFSKKFPTTIKREKWQGWSDIDFDSWPLILAYSPEFADKCDKWDQFTPNFGWHTVLSKQPQFADKCNKWAEFRPREWLFVLSRQPQFAEKCDKWEKFTGDDWRALLINQPQFADKCDWRKLNDEEWDELLKFQPQFAKFRPGNADPDDGATSEFDPTFAGRVASGLNEYMRSFRNYE